MPAGMEAPGRIPLVGVKLRLITMGVLAGGDGDVGKDNLGKGIPKSNSKRLCMVARTFVDMTATFRHIFVPDDMISG